MFEVDFHILNQKATPAIYADTLALRPAAGFAGRIFINTASPYGVYRDTGTSWDLIASNGTGGPGSTGVNGLNGSTNIGLGGTITQNTTINGFFDLIISPIKQFSLSTSGLNGDSGIYASSGSYYTFVNDGNSVYQTYFYQQKRRFFTTFADAEYGLDLDDNTGLFSIGDYGFDGKKNSIKVDDANSKIFFTTGRSTSITDPDLFYAENVSSSQRSVKIGDFGNFNNQFSLQVNDGGNIIFTTSSIGNNGIYITNENAIFGSQNSTRQLFLNCDITANNVAFFTSPTNDDGLKLDFANGIFSLGLYNLGGNYIDVDDTANEIRFNTSNLNFIGGNLQSGFSGGNTGEHLVITLNNQQYKIALQSVGTPP